MKKKIIICLVVILLGGLLIGGYLLSNKKNENNSDNQELDESKGNILDYIYSQDVTKNYGDIRSIPNDYNKDNAIEDNVYVSSNTGLYNKEVIEKFYENYSDKEKCFMRLMGYTMEGEPIISDVLYANDKVYVVVDSTRDPYSEDRNVSVKIFDKFGVLKYGDDYDWVLYNGEKVVEHNDYWPLFMVANDYIKKVNTDDIIIENMSIDKFYAINSANNFIDLRILVKDYSFEDAKKDKCSIKGNNAYCNNTLEKFIKDFNDNKATAIRIITKNDNGLVIKDVYYDSDFNKIYLVVDKSRVTNINEEDKEIKMYEYVKIREYSVDNSKKIDLIAQDVRDDYYLCDCIWEENEVFNLV